MFCRYIVQCGRHVNACSADPLSGGGRANACSGDSVHGVGMLMRALQIHCTLCALMVEEMCFLIQLFQASCKKG